MEMVHKIRRKSDGLYFEEKTSWGEKGKLFLSTDHLMQFVSNNPKFFDDFNDLEVVSYRLISHTTRNFTEWANYNNAFLRAKRRRLLKAGGFLFAIMASNLNKTIEDNSEYILSPNADGWFSIEEIISKTTLTLSFIKKIVKSYTVRLPSSTDTNKSTIRQAFKLNDDDSMICFHKLCKEKLYRSKDSLLVDSKCKMLVEN